MKTTLSGLQDHIIKQSTSSCKLAAPPGKLATPLTTSNTNRDKHMELLQVLELIYVKNLCESLGVWWSRGKMSGKKQDRSVNKALLDKHHKLLPIKSFLPKRKYFCMSEMPSSQEKYLHASNIFPGKFKEEVTVCQKYFSGVHHLWPSSHRVKFNTKPKL